MKRTFSYIISGRRPQGDHSNDGTKTEFVRQMNVMEGKQTNQPTESHWKNDEYNNVEPIAARRHAVSFIAGHADSADSVERLQQRSEAYQRLAAGRDENRRRWVRLAERIILR